MIDLLVGWGILVILIVIGLPVLILNLRKPTRRRYDMPDITIDIYFEHGWHCIVMKMDIPNEPLFEYFNDSYGEVITHLCEFLENYVGN